MDETTVYNNGKTQKIKNQYLQGYLNSGWTTGNQPVDNNLLKGGAETKMINPKPALGATGMSEELTANAQANQDQYTQDLTNKASTAEKQKSSSLEDLVSGLTNQKGETQLQDEAYKNTVDPLEGELKDINQQIFSEQQAVRRKLEELDKNPQGLFGGALADEKNRIQTESLKKQADLSVIQMGIQGKYDSAKAIADRAIQVQLEKQKNAVEALRLNYEDKKDMFTKAEQREFETKQNARERELDKQEKEMQTISDMSLTALQNGAPSSIASKIREAKTMAEAIKIGGQYMSDPLDRSIKAEQLRKLQIENNINDPEIQNAIINSVVNEKDPTKLISNFFNSNPKLKTNKEMQDAAAVVSSANELAESLGAGKITGYGLFGGGFTPEALLSQESIANKSKVKALNLKVQQWASGAALTKQQTKYVMAMIPGRDDTDATFRTKINNLTNYMLSDIKGRATTQGAQFEYIPVNIFSDKSAEPEVKSSVVQAVSSGYQPKEVVDYVSTNYPDKASQIKQARDSGYSDEEIIQYLSL